MTYWDYQLSALFSWNARALCDAFKFGAIEINSNSPSESEGGHIVFWEARLVIEFPRGACVLIPSATFTHSNIPVAPGSTRASFTQYAPGGLFRYVEYGFRLESELAEQDPALFEAIMRDRPSNWRTGLDLLPKATNYQKCETAGHALQPTFAMTPAMLESRFPGFSPDLRVSRWGWDFIKSDAKREQEAPPTSLKTAWNLLQTGPCDDMRQLQALWAA